MCRRGYFLPLFVFVFVFLPYPVYSQQEEEIIVFSGYYSRQGNDGELAEVTGKSQYIRFYPGERIIRLYIPYPYSKTVGPDSIRQLFEVVRATTTGSAYIRDDFGVLDQDILAHTDSIKVLDGEIKFDCSNSAPCEIRFSGESMKIIKPGIVKQHIVNYDLISD